MKRRIVVAGSRTFTDYATAKETLLCFLATEPADDILILSGGCRGADQLGERFAEEQGYALEYFSAQWKLYGKAAGPMRNRRMIDACDAVVCFWDGHSRGTRSLIRYARTKQKRLLIRYI